MHRSEHFGNIISSPTPICGISEIEIYVKIVITRCKLLTYMTFLLSALVFQTVNLSRQNEHFDKFSVALYLNFVTFPMQFDYVS